LFKGADLTVSFNSGAKVITPVNPTYNPKSKKSSSGITNILTGLGLTGGGNSGEVTLSANMNYLQRKIIGSCPQGSAISSISEDGTVNCQSIIEGEKDYPITEIIAGPGLIGGGEKGKIKLSLMSCKNDQLLEYKNNGWRCVNNLLKEKIDYKDLDKRYFVKNSNLLNEGNLTLKGYLQTNNINSQELFIDGQAKINGPLCLAGDCISSWNELFSSGIATKGTCGNNLIDPGEQCDGTAVPDTCASLGYAGGELTCNPNCTYNTNACSTSDKKYVFVTSTTTTGRIGFVENGIEYVGRDAADKICNNLANSAGLPGNYRAWLSGVAGGNAYSPQENFIHSDVPYYLPGDPAIKVADNWPDLTDGTIDNPINRDENGNFVEGIYVWTGTREDGATTMCSPICGENWNAEGGAACEGWGHAMGLGSTAAVNRTWTRLYYPGYCGGPSWCNNQYPIFCFQQ